MNYVHLFAAAAVALGAAWAEDGGKHESEFSLLNRYRESARAELWTETARLYLDLQGYPEASADLTNRFLHALARYELGELHKAEAELSGILKEESKHVQALYLLAKVHSKRAANDPNPIRSQQLKLEARNALIVAAGAGQYVYRDLQSAEGKALFGELALDSAFVLEVLRAASSHRVSTAAIHNPFSNPLRRSSTKDPDAPPPLKGEADLRKELAGLYEELVVLANEENYAELERKLERIGTLLARYGPGAPEASRAVRAEFEGTLRPFETLLSAVRLQEWVAEGNALLRVMFDSIQAEDYDAALAAFTQLEAIVGDMRDAQEPAFERNAERLLHRGRHLAESAQRHKEITEFTLEVTGIVVASTAAAQGSAHAYDTAIVNDRILRVGDRVFVGPNALDPNPNLRLVAIGEHGTTLSFEYFDTPFVRGIKSRVEAEAEGGAVSRQ